MAVPRDCVLKSCRVVLVHKNAAASEQVGERGKQGESTHYFNDVDHAVVIVADVRAQGSSVLPQPYLALTISTVDAFGVQGVPGHEAYVEIAIFCVCESVTQVRSREEHCGHAADTHKVDGSIRLRCTLWHFMQK